MRINVRFLVGVLFLFSLQTFLCASESSYRVVFNAHGVGVKFQETIPTIFKVARFTYVGNGPLVEQELQSLLGLTPGAFVTREQFLQGVARLSQKQCFVEGTFYFAASEEGRTITLKAESAWIIRSLSIKGVSLGKDEYVRLYEQAVGDPFVEERHRISVENITQFLLTEGYKQAEVQERVEYESETQTVAITITLKRGKLSTISTVSCVILDDKKLLSDDERAHLEKMVSRLLLKKFSTKKNRDKAHEALKKWLVSVGCTELRVESTETACGKKKVSVTVTVTVEKRRKTVFFGNHYFSFHELSKTLEDLGSAQLFLPPSVAAQELQSDYLKKGFWSASVESVQDGEDRDYFIIKEGPRSSLKEVILKGVEAVDPGWLQKQFFRKVERARFFDQELVESAIHECLAWYKKEGFWNATVLKQEYIPSEKNPFHNTLLVVIDEGKRSFLQGIEVRGFPGSYADLPLYEELTKAETPLPFPHGAVALQRTFLTKKVRELGYLHARLSYQLVKEPGGLRIIWNCDRGARVRFGKTITRGYSAIPYDRLLKLLSYQEGDLWDREKVQQSLAVLRSLDIFERISLYPSFNDVTAEQRDMILMVKDDDPFELKFRVGFAQVSKNFYFKKGSTYKAGGSLIWKNPLARADRLAVDVDYNRYEKKINASYKVPFLCGFPLATVFKVYANKYIQPVYIGSNKPLYQVLQQGFLMGVSKKRAHCDVGLTAGFDWMEINDISLEFARAINFKTDLVGKKIPYFFIEPMVYADFLNETLNPTEGFFGLATIKGMFPFKESSYLVKFLAEQGTFIPLRQAVLAIRFRAGHIFRREFDAVMPSERFYLGGPYSLRGYLQDHCPPLGAALDDSGQVQYVPQGGKTMFNANFELRVPFNQQVVWGAVFQDFGILIEDLVGRGIGSSKPLAATGFGIRYMTPVGPLRFDIGWKWHKDRPEDSGYAWFLTFGNAF